jgi:NADH-quinone oxidoreductase subunit G
MIKESGIVFSELEPEAIDMPFGFMTGAGIIFGASGGVTEAVLRRISSDKSNTGLLSISYKGVRGMDGIKEVSIPYGEKEIKIAVVSGLNNASALVERIKCGEKFDFVEVMACSGGCVCGAGQPFADISTKIKRSKGLYTADKLSNIKRSEENPLIMNLYNGVLKGKVKELLHVHYAENKDV